MRNHIKIVSRTPTFILIFLTMLFTPLFSHALIIQGAIGISLFNAFTTLFLFLFLPVAIGGVLLRSIGMKKTRDNKHWELNIKRLLILFTKYIIYHSALISGWFALFKIQTDNEFITANVPISANEVIIFNVYLITFAIIGPYFTYFIGKIIKKQTFLPTQPNLFRLYVWNIIIFWIASIILSVPLF